jgi:class 3 adenylate cyclase
MFAVRLDASNDYIGNVVNNAAKMPSMEGDGEIAFSKELYSVSKISFSVQECELEIEERPLLYG